MRIDAPTGDRLPALRALWKEAFGDSDAFLDRFYRTAFSASRCRCATEGERLLAALYWFDCCYENRRIAYLYAIATAKSDRGRGICHRLMEDTHRLLAEHGYSGAILVPADARLFDFYARMGYTACSTIREVSCHAAEETVVLRRIDEAEYAMLRRAMLPRGGVVQEAETLAFLSTHAEFYAGKNVLLAAEGEKAHLVGIELLGDVESAPRIVRALGYETGTFRTPGDGAPFAMYLPLKEHGIAPPTYFGHALDL